ncbi:MAG: T9SS type A sorting domain-containing protein [Ignavibacterium sp.]|nr:T9SS type A sorting domain-containing protein [Ignavibacterium sp.]
MLRSFSVLFLLCAINFVMFAQNSPTLFGQTKNINTIPSEAVLYEQMSGVGTNALSSQNFEASNDAFDNQAADDFVVPSGETWSITSMEIIGAYWNGTGPVASANVWFYVNNSGLPGSVVSEVLNVVPSDGAATGSLTITFTTPIELTSGTYWVSLQGNMDFPVGGQFGWTEHNQVGNPSVWQNPGGGFSTSCSSWGPRVATCGVGAAPYYDMAFRLNGNSVVPVELTSFTASVIDGNVILSWSTATETNNSGFEVERSFNGSDFANVAFVAGNGTSLQIHNYSITDKNLVDGNYSYRLKQIDFNGDFEYSKIINIEVTAPVEFSLAQNFPNPFNPSTKITFGLAIDSKVKLSVYNLLGEQVAELLNSNFSAGTHNVSFDASNLNSGVYFYRLDANGIDGQNFSSIKKMILAK